MSQLKVNAIRHTGASSDAVTLASDGTCTAKITNNLSNRNLVVNGSCIIAQRSSSAVTDDSYRTVDRFALNYSGTDNHPTQEQHALTSSDTGPWEKGFRYSYHVTNGDQTSGAGTGDKMGIAYKIEAQDIANSGWNYTSASSYITLSFWVKSSVAGDYKGYLYTYDGTPKSYPFATGSLTANTWTKVTKKIPGHADLQFDNNNDAGFFIGIKAYAGTSFTSNVTEDAWMTYASGSRTADFTSSTWWTTNDATFEITGLQLEVGDVATDFEHRSFGDELARCQRYFYMHANPTNTGPSANYTPVCTAYYDTANIVYGIIGFPATMNHAPDLYKVQGTSYFDLRDGAGGSDACDAVVLNRSSPTAGTIEMSGNVSGTAGRGTMVRLRSESAARIGFDAEL